MITGCFSTRLHTSIYPPATQFYLTAEQKKKKKKIKTSFSFILTTIDSFYTSTSGGAIKQRGRVELKGLRESYVKYHVGTYGAILVHDAIRNRLFN